MVPRLPRSARMGLIGTILTPLRRLRQLSIAQRVTLGFGFGAAVLVAVSLAAGLLIGLITDTLSATVNQVSVLQDTAASMKDAVSVESRGVDGYLITGDSALLGLFDMGHQRFLATAARLAAVSDEVPAAGTTAADVMAAEADFRRLAQDEIDLSRQGAKDAAAVEWQSAGFAAEESLRLRVDALVGHRVDAVQSRLRVARRRDNETRLIFAPLVAITAGLAILAGFVIGRSITRRIHRLESTIERIEQGDFRVDLTDTGHDELGRLGRSISNMATALDAETRAREALLDDKERANERIGALYDVARTVNQALDPAEVLRQALDRLLAHTRMHVGVELLRDTADGLFHVGLVRGLTAEQAVEVAGLFEEDAAQRWATELLAHGGLTRIDPCDVPVEGHRMRTIVAVPLRAKGNARGLLLLATPDELAMAGDEVRLIEGLTEQIGTALEHAYLYAQSTKLAATEERNRLARDLHDSVTQTLFSISMMSQALPTLIERNPARALERAGRMAEMARGALAEMRMLILELRPAALQEMGLVMALERYVTGFGSREGLQTTFCVEGLQRRLPHDQEEAIFRIAQEALNNVARHAQANSVEVVLEFEPSAVRLSVCDDGIGMPVNLGSGGFGMISMRERAEQLGGSLLVNNPTAGGCRVAARLPAPAATTSITV